MGVHGGGEQHERLGLRVPAVPGRDGGGGGRVRRGGGRVRHGALSRFHCPLEGEAVVYVEHQRWHDPPLSLCGRMIMRMHTCNCLSLTLAPVMSTASCKTS